MEEDFDSLKDIEEIMQKLYDGFSEAAKELKKLHQLREDL